MMTNKENRLGPNIKYLILKSNRSYLYSIYNLFKNATFILILTAMLFCFFTVSCGGKSDDQPQKVDLPSDPIQRAAINGLITSYRESTMWQIQNVKAINMTPMAPSGELLEIQDPKEVYCVCLQYEARYKVTWSTSEGSPWEDTIRNILVIRTQGDTYLALKPMNICSPFCG
ncbi:MAG: hypothetical protein LBD41_04665 [Clostridiales Family XIII bacterium]|nr:hypothetical protein [Clostridiales Family XIII bacterium]